MGRWGDFGEDIREEFDQDLQALLGVEMVQSLLEGFQLLVEEVLQNRLAPTLLFFFGPRQTKRAGIYALVKGRQMWRRFLVGLCVTVFGLVTVRLTRSSQ